MLITHLNAIENQLLTNLRAARGTGNMAIGGMLREAFIRQFLQNHLSEMIGFGSGVIIDSMGQQSNQIDILLYKKNYPKLNLGPKRNISGFFAESVIATIEVKSSLNQYALVKILDSIRDVKNLQRNIITSIHTGYQPPSILSFIVAFDVPSNMATVHRWLNNYVQSREIEFPAMPPKSLQRTGFASPLVDLIVVLGKGIIQFDNSPFNYVPDSIREQNPSGKWIVVDNIDGNLLMLFSQLTTALSGASANWMNIEPYLRTQQLGNASINLLT